jgi:hypothetical protein
VTACEILKLNAATGEQRRLRHRARGKQQQRARTMGPWHVPADGQPREQRQSALEPGRAFVRRVPRVNGLGRQMRRIWCAR